MRPSPSPKTPARNPRAATTRNGKQDQVKAPTGREMIEYLQGDINAWGELDAPDARRDIHRATHLISILKKGKEACESPVRNDEPLTLTITATGKVAASLRAVSFVSGKSLEEVALDVLVGIDGRADEPAELLADGFNILECGEDITSMATRFRRYRDANGIDYPDALVKLDLAEMNKEISETEAIARRLEISRQRKGAL